MNFRDKMRGVPDISSFRTFRHETTAILEDIEAETTAKGRVYRTPAGLYYPSVTTVLSLNSKDSIAKWRKRVGEEEANRISSEASGRGTRIHELCENYVNNHYVGDFSNPLVGSPKDLNSFKDIKKILDDHVGTVYAVEAPLYSDVMMVAGRTDLVAEWDDEPAVIDFKTSKKRKERSWVSNYFQQGACYCKMWEERTGQRINKFVIIISVDGDSPQVFIEKRDDHLPDFKRTRLSYKQAYRV